MQLNIIDSASLLNKLLLPARPTDGPAQGRQMKRPSNTVVSPIRKQATDALRRARKLPVGPHRNDLRQLAIALRWLEKQGLSATARDHATDLQTMKEFQNQIVAVDQSQMAGPFDPDVSAVIEQKKPPEPQEI